MTIFRSTKTEHASLARDLLAAAWYYLRNWRTLLILAVLALIGGLALNWSWLAAAGIAPILLATLPCLVMCGLGLCMNKILGGSCVSNAPPKPELAADSSASSLITATSRASDAGAPACCRDGSKTQPSADA
jgi:peptidoglycan/LPS O-acetylase OafA/YrhL